MNADINTSRNRRRGSSLIEFAVATPILFLALSGAVDFGRAFYNAIALKSGSAVGAVYGSQENVRSGDFAGMISHAEQDAVDASRTGEFDVSASQICSCPSSGIFPCGDYQATTCSSYNGSSPRAYVRVRAQQDFRPLSPFPGVPETANIEQYTWMRVR
jgi:hypothetical protein